MRPASMLLGAACCLMLASGPGADGLAQDQPEDLPAGPGREETFYSCSACHSFRLVSQQRLPRARWDKLLTWMVEKQGMPELPADQRALVLDYLAAHYGYP